jgi:hypothetical protein
MTPEKRNNRDWARQDREGDLNWIRENLAIFDFAARLAYEGSGRGAIVVDTTVQPAPGGGHPFGYFSQEQIEEHEDEDITRMVHGYDPEHEFVLVLLKGEGRTSTYRVRPEWGSQGEEGAVS